MVVVGVVAALAGALFLALGAQFQNRGVRAVGDTDGGTDGDGARLRIGQLLELARTPKWAIGTGLLTLAIVLQLVSLFFAPLAVVQPLGALSLVITAVLNVRMNHASIRPAAIRAIAFCVLGIAVFVLTASFTTTSSPDTVAAVAPVLIVQAVVLAILGIGYAVLHTRLASVGRAVAGGICFGFVATLAKVVIDRMHAAVQHGAVFTPDTWFTVLCLACLTVTGAFGLYLVQTAYAAGSPDLVVAALTVVDPLVAVTIGVTLLGEAHSAPLWAFAVFAVAEAVAIVGVVTLARNQPMPDRERQAA